MSKTPNSFQGKGLGIGTPAIYFKVSECLFGGHWGHFNFPKWYLYKQAILRVLIFFQFLPISYQPAVMSFYFVHNTLHISMYYPWYMITCLW
jgi:hypothetical protein